MSTTQNNELVLPSLPDAYLRINEVIADPFATTDAAVKVILLDTALSARILQMANTSVYRRASGNVATVSEAVRALGLSKVRDLALAASVIGMFSGPRAANFWEHSAAIAAWASSIAEASGDRNYETMTLAGMLHDIGRLVLMANYPDIKLAPPSSEAGESWLIEQEASHYERSHTWVGGRLLDNWGLPLYSAVAEFHHDPDSAPSNKKAVRFVAIAEQAEEAGEGWELVIREALPEVDLAELKEAQEAKLTAMRSMLA